MQQGGGQWKKSSLIHASLCFLSPLFSQSLLMMDISNMIYYPLIFHIACEYILLEVMLSVIAAFRFECAHTHTHTYEEDVSHTGRPIKLSFFLVQQSAMTGTAITSVNHVISIIPLHNSQHLYADKLSHIATDNTCTLCAEGISNMLSVLQRHKVLQCTGVFWSSQHLFYNIDESTYYLT